LLVGIRSLGESLQDSVRLSHDVQGNLGGLQPLVGAIEFAGKPGDLDLLGGEPPDLLPGPFPSEYAGIALLAPLTDQRRVQALPPQIRPTLAVLAACS
jgi:hypothetical protein